MSKYLNPVTGRISSKFGTRIHPVTGKKSYHNGVDIAVPIGTKVIAPADGVVIDRWDHAKGGKCLAIDCGGIRFGFAHLSKRLVLAGDKVKAGQEIAETGNTGASTGPHLHFTVKVEELWVDPCKFFTFQ